MPASSRVLVVTAAMGAGHHSAACALADRLRRKRIDVEIVDFMELPRWHQGDAVQAIYKGMIRYLPETYDLVMREWAGHPAFFERLTALGAGPYERALSRRIAELDPAAVVSTYNLAGQALGRMRRRGDLGMPLISYVTDPGPHPYWVAAGVDLHLAPLSLTANALQDLGADKVLPVTPLVELPARQVTRRTARRRWGLPESKRTVLINGGSWGVGEVTRTARALIEADGIVPVVLCGRSDTLFRRICDLDGAVAVPWTDDVAGLLTAADVLVDNAGGTTCWEALAYRRPVVIHRPIPGHGRLNAAALAAAGLATWSDDDAELVRAVVEAQPSPQVDAVFDGEDPAEVIAALV